VTWNYNKYFEENCIFARALITLHIPCYSTINIIGFNSPYWAIAFHGAILGNYLPIGLYTTNGPETCQYIANHSET
jgi:long-chain-fatty-acid--CoA ligase ACSBG